MDKPDHQNKGLETTLAQSDQIQAKSGQTRSDHLVKARLDHVLVVPRHARIPGAHEELEEPVIVVLWRGVLGNTQLEHVAGALLIAVGAPDFAAGIVLVLDVPEFRGG